MDKKAPRKEDAFDLWMRTLVTGSSSDAIISQEAAGQQSFVNSDTLPTLMSREDRVALETAGVVFGDVVQGDELFQYVQLPEGWKKSSTGHSMHSDLLDSKGRKRAVIFYKAASYDRRAGLHCVRRFNLGVDYDKLDKGVAEAIVRDGNAEVFRSSPVAFDKSGERTSERAAEDEACTEACDWLTERYPDWKNVAAYWD